MKFGEMKRNKKGNIKGSCFESLVNLNTEREIGAMFIYIYMKILYLWRGRVEFHEL